MGAAAAGHTSTLHDFCLLLPMPVWPVHRASNLFVVQIWFLCAYKVFDEIQEGSGVGLIYVSHVIYSQLQSSATSQVYVVFSLYFVIFPYFPLLLKLFTNHALLMQVEEKGLQWIPLTATMNPCS
jgi:hypothetical protein